MLCIKKVLNCGVLTLPIDFGNPVATGLMGGAGGLIIRTVWLRVMGDPHQNTIPVQLSSIHTQLANINMKLELIKQADEFRSNELEELKQGFYKHMEKYHSGGK